MTSFPRSHTSRVVATIIVALLLASGGYLLVPSGHTIAQVAAPAAPPAEALNQANPGRWALKNSGTASKDEQSHYEFLLTNTIDTIDNSAQDHRQLLSEQEEAAKHKKKTKAEPQ